MSDVKLKDIDKIDAHPIFRQKLLDKLNAPEQLDHLMKVTSPKSWLILLAVGLVFGSGIFWSVMARIESTVPASGILLEAEVLTAVVYVSLADSQRIRHGQSVKLAPSSVRQEQYGLLLGTVTDIQRTPATHDQMEEVLGNDALTNALTSDGLIVAVTVSLTPEDTVSGYAWTSLEGPPAPVYGGTLAQATIIIEEQRPLDLIWPY